MREIVHLQAGQCGNQIGSKVLMVKWLILMLYYYVCMHRNQLSSEFERKTTLLLSNKGIYIALLEG